jgi:hypothetical protein
LEGDLEKMKPGDDLEVDKPLHYLSNLKSFVKRYCYRRAQEDIADKNRTKVESENGKYLVLSVNAYNPAAQFEGSSSEASYRLSQKYKGCWLAHLWVGKQ